MSKRTKAPTKPPRPLTEQIAVAVAGMHRSGTSLVARILKECGLNLGDEDDLLQGRADNTEGFWENAKFVELNEAILQALGGAWDMPPRLEKGWERRAELEPLAKVGAEIMRGFERSGAWGWKDPRTSLTLPFWLALLPGLRVVVCVRHPLEVARSLTSRGSTSEAFGLRLWESYNAALLEALEGRKYLVSHYDAYFHDADAEVRRLLEYVGIAASEDGLVRAAARVNEFARHHRTPNGASLANARSVAALYERLCSLAGPVFEAAAQSGSSMPAADGRAIREEPASERNPPAELRSTSPGCKYTKFDDSPGSTHVLVVSLVPEGARVLEFGSATGYMSRVLRDKGCSVVGIEISGEAAEQARSHCERVLVGDAETLDLEEGLGDERFDVVLFADVLEHFRDPGAVLRRVRPFLASDGFVVASIPNVAHESVRLALLGGEFRYRPFGLLDDTHLRFFTRATIEELFESNGYVIERWHRRRLDAGQTEIDVPPAPSGVRERLAADTESTTYQFVVRAVPSGTARQLAMTKALLREAREELQVLRTVSELAETRRVELEAARHELESLRPLRRAAEELVTLRRAYEARSRQMAAQQARFADLAAQLDDELESATAELDWRRGVQEEHEKELAWRRELTERLDAELKTLQLSRSFRLTAPFRAAMNLVRRLTGSSR